MTRFRNETVIHINSLVGAHTRWNHCARFLTFKLAFATNKCLWCALLTVYKLCLTFFFNSLIITRCSRKSIFMNPFCYFLWLYKLLSSVLLLSNKEFVCLFIRRSLRNSKLGRLYCNFYKWRFTILDSFWVIYQSGEKQFCHWVKSQN